MLSQKIVTGNDALSTTFRDARNSLSHTPSFAVSDAAIYSASMDERATELCFLLHQEIAPPAKVNI
jgi:hypothetical protein